MNDKIYRVLYQEKNPKVGAPYDWWIHSEFDNKVEATQCAEDLINDGYTVCINCTETYLFAQSENGKIIYE